MMTNNSSDPDALLLAYITCESEGQALTIAEVLLDEHLIACANVLPAVTSLFRWKGKVERSAEVLLFAKTRRALFDRMAGRVRELHSYELPCIVALPLASGLPDYLAWVAEEAAGG